MVAEKQIKEIENSAVELTLTVPKTAVAEAYDKTVKKYCKSLQVKGFRKGKVPAAVLEQKYGSALKEETMFNIIESAVEDSIKDIEDAHKPLPYSTPSLVDEENLSFDEKTDFSFAVTYDVYPAFELPAYESLSVEVPEVSVSDEQINEELEKIQEQNSMITEKSEPAADGDIVTIDYLELDENDDEVEGTAREDFVFTIGTGYNFYKLDADIVGMSAGDEKIIEKTFGEDHDVPEYVGKTVKIKVTVKVVKVKQLPELDDELAQDVSDDYETLEDLKKATADKLQEDLDARIRSYKISKLYEKILEPVEISIPQSMIQAELENSWRNFASQSGMSEQQLTDLLGYQGKGKADLLEEWKPQAKQSILTQMLLEKVSEKEEVTVSDEDIADMLPQIEGVENQEQKDYYIYLMKEEKKSQKVIDLLLDKNDFVNGSSVSYTDFIQNKID